MSETSILDTIRSNPQILIEHIPHSRAIGMTVRKVGPAQAWIHLPYSQDLIGDPQTGVLHGGAITTLLDNAGGSAVILALPEPRSIATLDLRIDYMKPATPKRDLIGYCHCYKVTHNVAFARGVAYHDTPDDPVATMVATFMLGANRSLPAMFRESV